jgi:hypothetical protein
MIQVVWSRGIGMGRIGIHARKKTEVHKTRGTVPLILFPCKRTGLRRIFVLCKKINSNEILCLGFFSANHPSLIIKKKFGRN